jgi:hypothetical protein
LPENISLSGLVCYKADMRMVSGNILTGTRMTQIEPKPPLSLLWRDIWVYCEEMGPGYFSDMAELDLGLDSEPPEEPDDSP